MGVQDILGEKEAAVEFVAEEDDLLLIARRRVVGAENSSGIHAAARHCRLRVDVASSAVRRSDLVKQTSPYRAVSRLCTNSLFAVAELVDLVVTFVYPSLAALLSEVDYFFNRLSKIDYVINNLFAKMPLIFPVCRSRGFHEARNAIVRRSAYFD